MKDFDTLTTLLISAGCVAVGIAVGLLIAAMMSPTLNDVTAERDKLQRELQIARSRNQEQEFSHRQEMADVAQATEDRQWAAIEEKVITFINEGCRDEWAGATLEYRQGACLMYLLRKFPDAMLSGADGSGDSSRRLADDVDVFYMASDDSKDIPIISAMMLTVSVKADWQWLQDETAKAALE